MNSITLLKEFLTSVRLDRGGSEKTVEAYSGDLADFFTFTQIQNPLTTSEETIEKYISALSAQKLKPSSIARKVSALRQFFKFLCLEHGLKSSPCDRIETPKLQDRLPKSLSHEEITSLFEIAKAGLPYLKEKKQSDLRLRDRAMVGLLYASGLRVSELVGLELSDIDQHAGFLRVKGKGGKERLVPFPTEIGKWLREWSTRARPNFNSEHHTKVFVNSNGEPLSRQGFFLLLKHMARECGIPEKKVSPHVLRHSFATHLLEGGMGLRSLQMLLGHSDLSTTQIYTQITPKHLKEVHRKFHPRGGK